MMTPEPDLLGRKDLAAPLAILATSVILGLLGPWAYAWCFDGPARWHTMWAWPGITYPTVAFANAGLSLLGGWPLTVALRKHGKALTVGWGLAIGLAVAMIVTLFLGLLIGGSYLAINAAQVGFVWVLGAISGALTTALRQALWPRARPRLLG